MEATVAPRKAAKTPTGTRAEIVDEQVIGLVSAGDPEEALPEKEDNPVAAKRPKAVTVKDMDSQATDRRPAVERGKASIRAVQPAHIRHRPALPQSRRMEAPKAAARLRQVYELQMCTTSR